MPSTINGTVQALSSFFGLTLYLIILNGFGVLAICCKVTEYQVKKRATMLVIATIANFLWVMYFVFYGDWASALTCFVSSVRLLIFLQKGKHKWADSIFWLVFFLLFQAVVSVFTYSGWKDIFALVAGFVGIVAYYVMNQKAYRVLSLIFMSLWVINGVFKVYPIALISDTLSVISVLSAIIRFDIVKNKQTKKIQSKIEQ